MAEKDLLLFRSYAAAINPPFSSMRSERSKEWEKDRKKEWWGRRDSSTGAELRNNTAETQATWYIERVRFNFGFFIFDMTHPEFKWIRYNAVMQSRKPQPLLFISHLKCSRDSFAFECAHVLLPLFLVLGYGTLLRFWFLNAYIFILL